MRSKMTLLISETEGAKFMARYRSILSLMLVIVATFLVSCSSPSAVKLPQTYTVSELELIQRSMPEIITLRDRMSNELQALIQKRDWIDVSNFIHGPLGELRLEMINISRSLLPPAQDKARQLTRDLFDDLVKVDQAAKEGQYQKVIQNYREALTDIDNFLQLVPKST